MKSDFDEKEYRRPAVQIFLASKSDNSREIRGENKAFHA